MKSQIPKATKDIRVPAETLYNIIADYRQMHWLILPKQYFLSLEVEEGGFGAGTVINFAMRILGQTQSFHSLITEPEPGHLLVETDIKSGIATSFHIVPIEKEGQTRVTISTELKGRNFLEAWIAKMVLQKIYRLELALLAQVGEEQARGKRSSTLNQSQGTPNADA
jgi:uncharacterized protein YndB with AHSA1/START domain